MKHLPLDVSTTPPTEKACTKCRVVKPRGAFYARAASPDGLHGTCKDCQNTRDGDAAQARTLRNRAHQRALTILAERHAREFEQIKAEQHRLAEAEAVTLKTAANGGSVKLKAGRRGAGQAAADRLS